MSPLATDIYDILRQRVPADDGRITYGQLVDQLPGVHGITYANDVRVSVALGEIVEACRRNGLPLLPAIVVQGDDDGEATGEPGNGYFDVSHPEVGRDRERRTMAHYNEWQRVRAATYPETLN